MTKHKWWIPGNQVDFRNPETTEKLTFFLWRKEWGVFSPLWKLKQKTWVACPGKETWPKLNHWSCPRQHPHKSTMRNSAGSFMPCMPSLASSRTAVYSSGKCCKRFRADCLQTPWWPLLLPQEHARKYELQCEHDYGSTLNQRLWSCLVGQAQGCQCHWSH